MSDVRKATRLKQLFHPLPVPQATWQATLSLVYAIITGAQLNHFIHCTPVNLSYLFEEPGKKEYILKAKDTTKRTTPKGRSPKAISIPVGK